MSDKFNKNIIVLAALYIIPLTGLGIDIYVPSLPAITKYFVTSRILAQSTVSIYILGLGLSQLFCGNIIDHYGRRRPLLISMSCYFLLSIFIIMSKSITMVTYLRLLQGICIGFSAVSARSIFLDLFSGQEYYRKASYMTIAYAIGPIVAPAIGGYLQHYFGWQANFYFLIGYALLGLVIIFFFIPETIVTKSPLDLKLIMSRYTGMLTHADYILGVTCLSMLYSILMLFNLIGPFLVQNRLHYTAVVFGHLALLCGLSWFAGNVTNRLLLHISSQIKINCALAVMGISLIAMLILADHWFNLYVIVAPICLLLFAASVLFSIYFVHTPTLFPDYSATASAFMTGSFSLISSAFCLFLTKVITTHNQVPLAYGFLGLFSICVVANIAVNRLNKS